MRRLNVLILHRMGDPRHYREAVRTLEYMIPECRADINCIVHDCDLPFPKYLKEIKYHLIVLGPTFLCARYHHKSFVKVLHEFDFIRKSRACKVAMPQDDYDCSAILDEWMLLWSVDLVYTVCPENWSVLYPTFLRFGEVRLGFTGYISDSWIEAWKYPKPYSKRSIDVSYRASTLQANFGRLGRLKSDIAGMFLSLIPSGKKHLDISVDPKDMIPGSKWHSFLEDSRFCLVTASGSSLLDTNGEFRQKVNDFYLKNPKASFEEIERECFPNQDGKYIFTAISPRNIEAALTETVQIATPGSYSGLMHPLEHYIPLNEDCSNINEVLLMMDDLKLVEQMKQKCKKAILGEARLRRSVIVDEIINFAESVVAKRNIISTGQDEVEKKFGRYKKEVKRIALRFWFLRRIKSGLKAVAIILGYKYVKTLLLKTK
jgi:hypothetical protein